MNRILAACAAFFIGCATMWAGSESGTYKSGGSGSDSLGGVIPAGAVESSTIVGGYNIYPVTLHANTWYWVDNSDPSTTQFFWNGNSPDYTNVAYVTPGQYLYTYHDTQFYVGGGSLGDPILIQVFQSNSWSGLSYSTQAAVQSSSLQASGSTVSNITLHRDGYATNLVVTSVAGSITMTATHGNFNGWKKGDEISITNDQYLVEKVVDSTHIHALHTGDASYTTYNYTASGAFCGTNILYYPAIVEVTDVNGNFATAHLSDGGIAILNYDGGFANSGAVWLLGGGTTFMYNVNTDGSGVTFYFPGGGNLVLYTNGTSFFPKNSVRFSYGPALDQTNAKPAGFTVGSTAPSLWLIVTNNGVKGLVPWFVP